MVCVVFDSECSHVQFDFLSTLGHSGLRARAEPWQ